MGRMGHSTTRAAVIYQHRTTERDRFIAAAMSQIIGAELANPDSPSDTQRACEDHTMILDAGCAHRDHGSDVGFLIGAGDENRTRTISLGIGPIRAAKVADQPGRGTASTRDRPLVTVTSCTLIAR